MDLTPQLVAIAGLPGSGKSTLVREYAERGYVVFDDPGAEWDDNLVRIADELARGSRVVVAEIMFCTEEWRLRLENAVSAPVHWRWFENNPWQCGVNCLYRLMVQLDDRPLMDMLYRIAELSPQYKPPADEVLRVVAADARLRRPESAASNVAAPSAQPQSGGPLTGAGSPRQTATRRPSTLR